MGIKNIFMLGTSSPSTKLILNNIDLNLEIGGSSKNTIQNVDVLKDLYNIHILCYGLNSEAPGKSNGIEIIPLKPFFSRFPSIALFNFLKKFNSKYNENEALFLVSNKFLSGLLIKLMKPKSKVIFIFEGDFKHALWSYYFNNIFTRVLYCIFSYFALFFFDKIIVDKESNYLNTSAISTLKRKTFFIPNSIDSSVFFPANQEKNKKLHLLYIGRIKFFHQKNPELLIKSFQIIHNKYKDAILTIIGTSEAELKKLLNEYDSIFKNIICIESLKNSELAVHYKSNDLLLLTSKFEGTPYTILESLACGTPCISTNVIDKNVIINGVNGYLCESFSAIDFANLIEKGIDLSKELKKEPKSLLDPKYDLANRKSNLLALINSL